MFKTSVQRGDVDSGQYLLQWPCERKGGNERKEVRVKEIIIGLGTRSNL